MPSLVILLIACGDLLRIGVDREMQIVPAPAGSDPVFLIKPFNFGVDLHPRAVDEQVQRLPLISSCCSGKSASKSAIQNSATAVVSKPAAIIVPT